MQIFISTSAVPLSLIREHAKKWDRSRYAELFNKYGSGKGKEKYRIYIPITAYDFKAVVDKHQVPEAISSHLSSLGYSVVNYQAGLAQSSDSKRTVRIGKLLKDLALKKLFDNDPQRAASKATPAWVVISRHPYDIVGMSFDRGWSSCMHLTEGSNRRMLKADVRKGTLVAYLIRNDDRNINNPISRISIKPYARRGVEVLVPQPTYGAPNKAFSKIVQEFCDKYNHGKPAGKYRIRGDLYADDLESVIIGRPQRVSIKDVSFVTDPQFLSDLAHKSTDNEYIGRILANKNAPVELIEEYFSTPGADAEIARNPNLPDFLQVKLARQGSQFATDLLAANDYLCPEAAEILARSEYEYTRARIAEYSKKLSDKTWMSLATDEYPYVRVSLARNQNTPIAAQLLLAKDEVPQVVRSIAATTKDPEVMKILLADFRSLRALVGNDACPQELMIQLVKDFPNAALYGSLWDAVDEQTVAIKTMCRFRSDRLSPGLFHALLTESKGKWAVELATSKHLTEDQYTEIAGSKSAAVLKKLASNPMAPSSVLDKLARSRVQAIRSRVAVHRNTSVEALIKLSQDPAPGIRSSVYYNPNTPNSIKKKIELVLEDDGWVDGVHAEEDA